MRSEDNCGGGESIVLCHGDSIDDVPASHAHLLSPALCATFADPVAAMASLLDGCPFTEMRRWISALLDEPLWELHLHKCNPDYGNWSMAGFEWTSDHVLGATVCPPKPHLPELPATLTKFYSLTEQVHWSVFGGAGGLYGSEPDPLMSNFSHYCDEIEHPDRIYLLGSSGGGDMLIYSTDDLGGWLCHENGKVHWLGSIDHTINWVFAELCAGREPDYDYDWK